jgi:hypothetical protein
MANETIHTEALAAVGKMASPSRRGERLLIGAYALAIAYVVVSGVGVWLAPMPKGMGDVAVLFGVLLGHNTCANLWMSLGTGSYRTRCNWGVPWMAFLMIAFAVRAAYVSAGNPVGIAFFALFAAVGLVVQASLVRALLWMLHVCFGIELTEGTHSDQIAGKRRQFGIAQLMAFVTMMAVVFAVGQGLSQLLYVYDILFETPVPLFLFLVAISVVVTLPMAAACLDYRYPVVAVTMAVLIVAGVTVLEVPVLAAANMRGTNDFDLAVLAKINAMTSLIVLGYGLGLRFFGFRLTMGKTSPTRAS